MYYFWATLFLALMVFVSRLPATVRKIRAQREALRPVQPISRADHLPCIVNTIGAAITEFALLGLLTFGIFVGSNAALGTLGQAPDLTTGVRHISIGAISLILAVIVVTGLLLIGGKIARHLLMLAVAFAIVTWMVMSSTGDQWPAVIIFGLLAYAAPAMFVMLLRILF
jgi:hypothetical protein